MKNLLFAAMIAIAAPAIAQAGNMDNMSNMGQGAMVSADGVGVVTALDAKAGSVTIHHSPIAKLYWPAMTMTFRATSPSILQGVKVGQSVSFTLMQMGGTTTLTAIKSRS